MPRSFKAPRQERPPPPQSRSPWKAASLFAAPWTSRQYIELALKQANHNKNGAAKLLGLNSHQFLTARMNKLGIEEKWG